MSESLESVLGAARLDAFEAPGPVATGLPGEAYTSEAFLALENERIFSDSWVFAGFAHELASAGDAVPVTVAGRPVLLVRDAELEIRAFHNVCRHRCLKLVDAPGNVGRAIRCPYHAWTYGLDGVLHIAPYFGGRDPRMTPPGFNRGKHGLVPVRSSTWHDWVFVDLGGAAPPVRGLRRPAPEPARGARFHPGCSTSSPSTSARSPRTGSSSWRTSSSPTTSSSCTPRPPSNRSRTTTR